MDSAIQAMKQNMYDPKLKIWSGPDRDFPFSSDDSLGKVLLKALLDNPEKIAQIHYETGKQMTNREMAETMLSISMHFNKLGFEQEDVVAFCGYNTIFAGPLLLGAALNGIIVNTMDPSFPKSAIRHMVEITKPKIMFCDKSNYELISESLAETGLNIPIFTMDEIVENVRHISEFLSESIDINKADYSPVPLKLGNEKQAAFILCSSGTTGPSKGIAVSHAGLLHTTIPKYPIPNCVTYTPSSLYWSSGILSLVHSAGTSVTRIISSRPFSPERFLDIIEKYKVNASFSAPSEVAQLAASPTIHKRNLQSFKLYLCAGSYVPTALIEKMKKLMPGTLLMPGYGMTEVPAFGISAGPAKECGNNGYLYPRLQLRIINEDGQYVGPNEKGELLIRSDFPFLGYYGNPEATAQICDAEGWISTGDIGYMNDEGELYVVDRKKEVYKYNGFKYSANEIENVIMELPEVAECCVCAIPDIVHTDIPAALIVLKPGATLSEPETAVYEHVANKLENHKHLRGGVYVVDSIPKTASGKNLRREAVKICEELRAAKNKA